MGQVCFLTKTANGLEMLRRSAECRSGLESHNVKREAGYLAGNDSRRWIARVLIEVVRLWPALYWSHTKP